MSEKNDKPDEDFILPMRELILVEDVPAPLAADDPDLIYFRSKLTDALKIPKHLKKDKPN